MTSYEQLQLNIQKQRELENKVEFYGTFKANTNIDNIVVIGYIRMYKDKLLIPTAIIQIILAYYIQKESWLMVYAAYNKYVSKTPSQIQLQWIDLNIDNNTFCSRYDAIRIEDDFKCCSRADSAYALVPNDENNDVILYRVGYANVGNRKYNLTKGTTEIIPQFSTGQPTIGHRAIYSNMNGLFVVTGEWQFGAGWCTPYIEQLLVHNDGNYTSEHKYQWQQFRMEKSRKYSSVCLWNKDDTENEKLFVVGGQEYYGGEGQTVEVFNIGKNMQRITVSDMNHKRHDSGICEWKQRNHCNIFVVGGVCYQQKDLDDIDNLLNMSDDDNNDDDDDGHSDYDYYDWTALYDVVEEYDGHKDEWYILPSTNYQHGKNPCVSIINEYGVLVVLGGMEHEYIDEELRFLENENDGGQIELFDPRDSAQKWMKIKNLNKFVSTGNMVEDDNEIHLYGPTLQQIMFML